MRRRVWCETLPYDQLLAPAVMSLLVRYRLDLLLAVRPWHVAEFAQVHARLLGAGIHVGLWPMIEDDHGRWASVRSQQRFVAMVDALLAAVPSAREVVVDLEPAFADLKRWKMWRPTFRATVHVDGVATVPRSQQPAYLTARAAYVAAIARWQQPPGQPARQVSTALMPMLAFDTRGQWLQRALGTPADDLPVQSHSVMAYTSLFEGWSRGLVGRQRAEWLLAVCARRSRERWGERAAISLGAVGVGAFGDEPTLRDPGQLRSDVAIARTAGIAEISLFDLGGVLRRGPAEPWLEALCHG
jgi:hypothetical protein